MKRLVRNVAERACTATIYVAAHILQALAAQRPHHDEPLPDGHTPIRPDAMRPDVHPDYRDSHNRLMAMATTQWANRPADPRNN